MASHRHDVDLYPGAHLHGDAGIDDVEAAGVTLTATASLIAGTASGSVSQTVDGVTLTATVSFVAGSANDIVVPRHSHRHAAELIESAHVHGEPGLGVFGSDVPSTGTHGASFLFNDLSLPADAAVEVRGLITTAPVGLDHFFVYEDGSFEAQGPDGTYSFRYQLHEDGAVSAVDIGFGAGIAEVTFDLGTSIAAAADGQTLTLSAFFFRGAAFGDGVRNTLRRLGVGVGLGM